MGKRTPVPLPPIARRFVRRRKDKKARAIVQQLYRWMQQERLETVDLHPWHVDRLVECPFGKTLTKRTRYDYRGELLRYLELLYAKGELSFDPSELRRGPLQRRPLPQQAEQYVESLATTLRPGTCRGYRTHLRRFCRWLDEHAIDLERLDRRHIGRWLARLKARGLGACTRAQTIVHARAFLRWLYERGQLPRLPDLLIRPSDIPKRPRYLPRPISPEADRELRARLAQSSCRYQRGLLLMRDTGLRIGELVSLPHDCLQTDLHGNCFLKVPLGKLNNERLVPLDADTVRLVHELQSMGQRDRLWLLYSPMGQQAYPDLHRRALRKACDGIDIDGPMTTHRLRHTYATSLLSGGMSLVGVMKLLGHLSYQTTLRYAAITQETIGREYFAALAQIEQRYQQQLQHRSANSELDPRRMLSDVARWVHNHIAHEPGKQRAARRLIKRLHRLEAEIQQLTNGGDPR
jgi:site-specific recombinase XerD